MSSTTELAAGASSESLDEKKYRILKRKCDSLEEANEALHVKLNKIRKMIAEAESEKKLLEKRLQVHEFESPPTDTPKTENSKAPPTTGTNSLHPPPPFSNSIKDVKKGAL